MSKKPTKFTIAAKAVAACYTKKELEAFEQALDTASDDSYEWSKQSDEGDDRRQKEMDSLDMMTQLIVVALLHKTKKTT
jgi:hypothetical protein